MSLSSKPEINIVGETDLSEYGILSSGDPHINFKTLFLDNLHMPSLRGVDYDENIHGLSQTTHSTNRQRRMILECLKNDTQGKSILDLGCGSTSNTVESHKYHQRYHPWIARFLHSSREETGLNVIGVDIGNNKKEDFESIQIDLTQPDLLVESLKDKHKFDLITAFKLFNSPELEKRTNNIELLNASQKTAEKLREVLQPQVQQLLKPEGVFLRRGGPSGFSPR